MKKLYLLINCLLATRVALALMRCTASGSRSKGCAAQFLAMRECNRAGGKQLLADGAGYAVAPGKTGLFNAEAGLLLQSTPPVRSLAGMQEYGQDYAKSLGIPEGEALAFGFRVPAPARLPGNRVTSLHI
ncbi:hypothetical protein AK812_SmicGene41075 [Symbiodinium microadriaticum]|uniref:Uncharacterized protein n=1 Tax=Symbiodinium microadriaticum TaxID=2951 RepID=A0A1Q9C724_SYMMI|nr:hypothetical protein AK812_SmicGene41075 [Symbiodinium microadriaticum]